MPKGSAVALGFEHFAAQFTEQSGGRYKVETYPLSGLFPDAGSLDALRGGVAELVMTSTGSKPNDFPAAAVTGLPSLSFHRNGVSYEEYEASAKAWDELLKNPVVAAEFEPYKLIQPIEIDPSMLVTKSKSVIVPEDMRGLKVGNTGGALTDYLNTYGAASVNQIPPQSYMNLDKGVTDASLNTWAQIGPYKLYEIVDYVNTTTFQAGALLIMANWDFWNSMPAADQDLFMKVWNEGLDICYKGMVADNVKGLADAKALSNIKIINPSEAQAARWDTAAEVAFETWAENGESLGVEDPSAIIDLWRSLRDKYTTQK
jgi:TRAP-type C4-dicarboxylate transport system substrate-binding protein